MGVALVFLTDDEKRILDGDQGEIAQTGLILSFWVVLTGFCHPNKLEVRYGSTEDCIDAAITGRWTGEWG